jgi:hypothetical protein
MLTLVVAILLLKLIMNIGVGDIHDGHSNGVVSFNRSKEFQKNSWHISQWT